MTRVCQYWQIEFGEKCGRCGSEDVHLLMAVSVADMDFYGCMACGHTFIRGEDGRTHGICEACNLKAMFQAMPVAGEGGAACTN
jgi:DNA-directed RNA polymerase subunit RPC12/RpoP